MAAKKLALPLLVICILLLSSCNKNNDSASTKIDFLTRAPWKAVKQEIADAAGVFSDVTIDDCQKDDAVKFNTDQTVITSPGAIKCDALEVVETDTWAFGEGEKTIILDTDAPGETRTIDFLDNDKLVFIIKILDGTEVITGRLTFNH